MRNFFIGLLIVLPAFALAILVYNPTERALVKADQDREGTVSYMGRVILGSKVQNLEVPYKADTEVCTGASYCYVDSGEFIVYTKAQSIAWKEYCSQKDTYILYSSVDNFTGLVCGGTPTIGKQRFANR